jgi:hypothetical protein
MRLSGWQRIGIVASILWFVVGCFIGNEFAFDDASTRTRLSFDNCVAGNKRRFGEYGPYDKVWTPCWNQYSSQFMKNAEGHWLVALAVAVIPLPIAWLLGWLLIATARWIARGFSNKDASAHQ